MPVPDVDGRINAKKIESIGAATLRTSQFGKEVKGFPPGFKEENHPLAETWTKNEQENTSEAVNAVLNADDPERRKEIP